VSGICSRKFYNPNQFGETEPKLLMRLNRGDGESINRFRKAERSGFDEALLSLLKQDRYDHVPESDPILIITLVLLKL
jgi:hypothetical protein